MSVRPRPVASSPSLVWYISLAPYLSLLKLRVVALLVFVSLVAAILAGHGIAPVDKMLFLVMAGAASSAGAAALNQYFERDIDAAMARTRSRALPSGQVAPAAALWIGLGLVAASLLPALALGVGSTIFVMAGAFFYVLIYTLWLKRSSCWNVPIGGIAGSCAVLTGWAAINDQVFVAAPLLMALILFFWNQSHFWAFAIARDADYRRVRVPMLPVIVGARPASFAILVNTIGMVSTSIAVYFAVPMHATYLAGASAAGIVFLCYNVRLVLDPSPRTAWTNFKFSGIYLLAVFLAMALDVLQR